MYIDDFFQRFEMGEMQLECNSKGNWSEFSKDMNFKTLIELYEMRKVPYLNAIDSVMYALVCTTMNIAFAVS